MNQFVKFCIIGASNVLVSYGIYVVTLLGFDAMEMPEPYDYLLAQFIGFSLSVLWSFFWNNRFVFDLKSGETRSVGKALLKTYASYSFTGIFLNSALLFLWIQLLGISEFVAPIINVAISTPVNFLLNKYWAFARK